MLINSPFFDHLQKQMDSIHPHVGERLEELNKLPESVGKEVVRLLLSYACESQNVANIHAAREALAKMPAPWLQTILPPTIKDCLHLDDEWEYRRLLELLEQVAPQLLSVYVAQGLDSRDLDIRETAEDFVAT